MALEVASTHYIARVVLEKVDHMQEPAKTYVQGSEPEYKGRKVTEVASISLRGDQLPKLIDRVTQHLGLVDELDAIDDQHKTMRGQNRRVD